MLPRVQRNTGDKTCTCLGCSQTLTTRIRTKPRKADNGLSSLKKQVEFMRNKNRRNVNKKVNKNQKQQNKLKIKSRESQKISRVRKRVRRPMGSKSINSMKKEKVDTTRTENEDGKCDNDSSLRIESVFSLAENKNQEKESTCREDSVSLLTLNLGFQKTNESSSTQSTIPATLAPTNISNPNTGSVPTPQFFLLPLGGKNVLIPTGKITGKPKAYVYDSRLPLQSVTENICSFKANSLIPEQPTSSTSLVTNKATQKMPTSFANSQTVPVRSGAHHKNVPLSEPISENRNNFVLSTDPICHSNFSSVNKNCEFTTSSEERINKLKERLKLQHKAVQKFSKDSTLRQSSV